MDKFLVTLKSGNPITGPILVTTSPRASCPLSCPLRKKSTQPEAGVCYAEHGHLGHYIWTALDRTPAGEWIKGTRYVFSLAELARCIRIQPPGTLWRHNQAGDLPSDDGVTIARDRLRRLTAANTGRRGFTYTHFDVVSNKENREAVKEANDDGFTVNLSADSLEEADELAALGIAPVTVVVPATQTSNTATPEGRQVVICPARVRKGINCAACGICATKRKAIIAFPALGRGKEKLRAVA